MNTLDNFLPSVPPVPDGASSAVLDELTSRERQVLDLVARGLGNGSIGKRLGISEKTVRNHVSAVFGKLGVNSRPQAIVWARDAGFGRKLTEP